MGEEIVSQRLSQKAATSSLTTDITVGQYVFPATVKFSTIPATVKCDPM